MPIANKSQNRIQAAFELMRPHQYVKNGFVFIGPVFAHRIGPEIFLQALLVFLAFCLAASAVYVLNDLVDRHADAAHPLKKSRPIASGRLSVPFARILFVLLLAPGLLIAAAASKAALAFVGGYVLLNVLYSYGVKRVVILDVFSISAGFMLRILAGTLGLGIEPSPWLLLCGMMLTLFLGFSKRRAELLLLESHTYADHKQKRRVLEDYSPAVLDQFIAVTAACTILSYGLYTVSPQTIALHGDDKLVYTLPFVIYGILRYMLTLRRAASGHDAARDLVSDPHLLFTVAAWLIVTVWILA